MWIIRSRSSLLSVSCYMIKIVGVPVVIQPSFSLIKWPPRPIYENKRETNWGREKLLNLMKRRAIIESNRSKNCQTNEYTHRHRRTIMTWHLYDYDHGRLIFSLLKLATCSSTVRSMLNLYFYFRSFRLSRKKTLESRTRLLLFYERSTRSKTFYLHFQCLKNSFLAAFISMFLLRISDDFFQRRK